MKTALVVIDVQNYFVNEKTKELPAKIATYIRNNKFDFVLFTQFINRKGSNFFKLLNWRKSTSSPEIDIHSTLVPFVTKNNLFKKYTYSIFKSKDFTEFLNKNRISKVYLCGIDSDSCVLASAFDAFDLDYEVKVLTDLSMSHSGDHSAALRIINRNIQKI